MTRRYEITDEQYAMIADLMPATGKPGGQWNDHRTTLDGIFWILHTGAQWRSRAGALRASGSRRRICLQSAGPATAPSAGFSSGSR